MTQFCRFLKCKNGATAIEYGLIAALMIVVIFGTLALVGDGVKNTLYTQLASLF